METLALAVGVLYLVWIGYRIIARLSPLLYGNPDGKRSRRRRRKQKADQPSSKGYPDW